MRFGLCISGSGTSSPCVIACYIVWIEPSFVSCRRNANFLSTSLRRMQCYRSKSSRNSLIIGYVKSGQFQHALDLYQKGHELGFSAALNGYAYVALLKACAKMKDLKRAMEIHSDLRKSGLLVNDPFVRSTLLDLYLKSGALTEAQEIFDTTLIRDSISWTSLISAYTRHGHGRKALCCFEAMEDKGILLDSVAYICALKACGSVKAIEKGCEIHAQVESNGLLQSNLVVATALVDMYAKCGSLDKAKRVFDKLSHPTVVSWNALMSGYVRHGYGDEALKCYKQMKLNHVASDPVTFICTLKACALIREVKEGEEIHGEIEKMRLLEKDPNVGTALIDMYAKCGCLAKAQTVFNTLPCRNTITWNALIGGYTEQSYGREALHLFAKMQAQGVPIDSVTFTCSLKACATIGAVTEGEQIHAEIARRGILFEDLVIGNTLIDMYAKCGNLAKAQDVLESLPSRNVVSWNALISGYTELGFAREALDCYEKMKLESIEADVITTVSILRACGSTGEAQKGQEIHAEISRRGLLREHVEIANSLIDMYNKFGAVVKALQVFDALPVRDSVITWNSIISGCTNHGYCEEALEFFQQMQLEGVLPDAITYVCSLKSLGSLEASSKGQEMHAKIESEGLLEKDHHLGTALVDMYAKCGMLEQVRKLFGTLPKRDSVAWNAVISGYAEHGYGEEALESFEQMKLEHVRQTPATFVSALRACALQMAGDVGLRLHSEIARQGYISAELVGNTLVDMYVKCGSVGKAREVFDGLSVRDVVSWTALIAGYVEQGQPEEALNRLEEMQTRGIAPNSVTYIFGLKACASIGAMEKGQEIHAEIERLGLLSLPENDLLGNAAVDMYAKCGALAMARKVFGALPVRCVASYNCLMSGYAHIGEAANALCVYEGMLGENIKPDSVSFVVILNACSQANLSEVSQVHFEAMEARYEVSPTIEHYTCMIDLLSRSGRLDKALSMIEESPCRPDLVVWHTILGACKEWGNSELGTRAFLHALASR